MFFGGLSIKKDEEVLKKNCPHVVVGTPGRILALVRNRSLNLKNVKHFVLDECDKMLEQLGEYPYWSTLPCFPCTLRLSLVSLSGSGGWPEQVSKRDGGKVLVMLLSPASGDHRGPGAAAPLWAGGGVVPGSSCSSHVVVSASGSLPRSVAPGALARLLCAGSV